MEAAGPGLLDCQLIPHLRQENFGLASGFTFDIVPRAEPT